ncbi:MAG TPA: MFS transporter [Dehalococcoidia bacterium]|nr:MFS transporter [Dehalococcoidia bacterium]
MNRMTRGFSAFRHRNYRLYFGGQSLSLVGTLMQTVAQAWLVLKLTNSAVDLGIVTALQSMPMLFIGWYGGAFADRLPKQRLLIVTQSAQMLLAFALGALVSTGVVQIWHVYLLALGLGVATSFDAPTRQSFVIEMVGRDDLMNAVALNSMTFNLARIIGPAVAGILISLVGVTSSFYINGISFLFVIGGLLLMRTREFYALPAAPRVPLRQSLAEGFAYMRHTPAALTITTMIGVMGMFAFTSNVLVPLFAQNVLNVGASGLGVLFSAMGVGSLLAGLIAAFAQEARWSRMFVGGLGMGLSELVFALSTNYAVSIVAVGFVGLFMFTFITSANTGIQQRVPDRLRGRVMGIYMAVNMGSTPFGNLAVGGIAGAFGAPVAMFAGGAAACAGIAGIGSWMLRHRRTADLRLAPEIVPVQAGAERLVAEPDTTLALPDAPLTAAEANLPIAAPSSRA